MEFCDWICPVHGMRGFNRQLVRWTTTNRLNLYLDCTLDVVVDDETVFPPDTPGFCVHVIREKCHQACRHMVGCDKNEMVCTLLVKHSEGMFQRIGVMAVYSSSFDDLPISELRIT